jgi:sec-independent protein translocase protein TatC
MRATPGQEKHNDVAMPFWDHVSELAKRLKIVLYVLIVSTVLFMVLPSNLSFLSNPLQFYDPLVALVLRQIRAQILPPDVTLIGYELTVPLELYMIASFVMGFAVSIPVIAYEMYRFIDPALYPQERGAIYPFVLSFTALFIVGAVFGYVILVPFMIWGLFPFFSAMGAARIISIMDFYSMVLVSTVLSGLIFTWPVFFILLVRFGILKTSMITSNRKFVYAAMYIITAFVTPDGGPLADIMLFIPMALLTEAAVYAGKRYEKSRPVTIAPARAVLRCRFCTAEIEPGKTFCGVCGKAQL